MTAIAYRGRNRSGRGNKDQIRVGLDCYCRPSDQPIEIPAIQIFKGLWRSCTDCRAICRAIIKLIGRRALYKNQLQIWALVKDLEFVVLATTPESYRKGPPLDNRMFLCLDICVNPKLPSSESWMNVPVMNSVPGKINASYVANTVRKWISGCDTYHPMCTHAALLPLPTRILYVGGPGDRKNIKLLVTSGERARYIALSYCWGISNRLITTTKSIPDHIRNIPWRRLPQTFKDAILVCWELDVQYIWIDSLCILQDDNTDWEQESANMASIYSNSYITISATSCSNSDTSLFRERWTELPTPGGHSVRFQTAEQEFISRGSRASIRASLHLAHHRFIEMENAKVHEKDAPLLTRAWAFQERLLPTRTLHFHAEELAWECNTSMRCECSNLDGELLKALEAGQHNEEWLQEVATPDGWLKTVLTAARNTAASMSVLSFAWLDLVSEFSRLDLTYETDRLPALSGLANYFSRPALGRYLAGIWEGDLAAGLLYESNAKDFYTIYSTDLPKAPTWSWASIPLHGTNWITYNHMLHAGFQQSNAFSFISIDSKMLGKNPMSWVSVSTLTVSGLLSNGRIWPDDDGRAIFYLEQPSGKLGQVQMMFIPDGRVRIKENMEISLLVVGHCQYGRSGTYGLALQKLPNDAYQRIGLLLESGGLTLSIDMEVAEISII